MERPQVAALCEKMGIKLRVYDLDTVDGLAEAAFAGVGFREPLPVIRIEEDGRELAVLHTTKELKNWLEER